MDSRSTRVSILASIVRVLSLGGMPRCITLGVGISFGLIGTAVFALRLQVCIVRACLMTRPLLIIQTVSKRFSSLSPGWRLPWKVTAECIADVLLSVLPLWFLRSMNLSRQKRILLSSAFSATMVINVITIVEAVVLLRSRLTSGTIIFEHVKVACSLIVCNLLVIDTFIYRVLYKNKTGVADSTPQTRRIELTTMIELGQIEVSQDRSTTAETTKSSSWSFHGTRPMTSGSAAAATY